MPSPANPAADHGGVVDVGCAARTLPVEAPACSTTWLDICSSDDCLSGPRPGSLLMVGYYE